MAQLFYDATISDSATRGIVIPFVSVALPHRVSRIAKLCSIS